MRREVDKMVVAQFLEAIKEVLDHLSRWKIELNQRGQEAPREVTSLYGRVRRLRDYLQRSVAAYPSPVQLDLSEDDDNLLSSCAVHEIGHIDMQLQAKTPRAPPDTAWLETKRRSLAHWAVQLATRPLERIPSPDGALCNGASVRAVVTAIQGNLSGRGGHTAPLCRTAPPGLTQSKPDQSPRPAAAPDSLPFGMVPVHTPDSMRAPAVAVRSHAYPMAEPAASPPRPQASFGLGSPFPSAPPSSAAVLPWSAAESQGSSTGAMPLVDPRRVHDPRLRGMLVLDLRAYERAEAAEDFRLAIVHLSSVLECAVLDFAITHTHEVGLAGPPESWNTEDILSRVLGNRMSAMDRAHLFQLIAARTLIRPSIQMQSPMVVTPASLGQTANFVRRVLVELGFAGTLEQPPQPPQPTQPPPPMGMAGWPPLQG